MNSKSKQAVVDDEVFKPTDALTGEFVDLPEPVILKPENGVASIATKKVAIVGFTNSMSQAPWGQEGWEIWICNNLWKFTDHRWHRLYDLHDAKTIESDKEHVAFLSGFPQTHISGNETSLKDRPVYSFYSKPDWKSHVPYPKDQITDLFGRYFTNSISWMIAHAIAENATEIHVYGVDMAQGTEYANQRPSCEYFLGLAAGMGIKVYVPPESDLLKNTTLYGAEDDSALYMKISERERELRQRIGQVESGLNDMQRQLFQLQGALETTNYFKTVWTTPRAERDGGPKEVSEVAQTG